MFSRIAPPCQKTLNSRACSPTCGPTGPGPGPHGNRTNGHRTHAALTGTALMGTNMQLFGDTVQMKWNKDKKGRYHGHGYGIGESFIFVGEFQHGEFYGDLIMYHRKTGERIMKVEMEENMAHGKYEFYLNGETIESGMYKRGDKYFHTRFRDNKVIEYGFSKDDHLHGYGCSTVNNLKYISPHWRDGKINGLGCIQDDKGEVYFYGQFKDSQPVKESQEKHPMMLDCWKRAQKYNSTKELAYQCAEYVLG